MVALYKICQDWFTHYSSSEAPCLCHQTSHLKNIRFAIQLLESYSDDVGLHKHDDAASNSENSGHDLNTEERELK